jgi:hypothetical protein
LADFPLAADLKSSDELSALVIVSAHSWDRNFTATVVPPAFADFARFGGVAPGNVSLAAKHTL